jgi:AraC-like DNA-binding protein
MSWKSLRTWSLPLQNAPRVLQMGIGTHGLGIAGRNLKERYRLDTLWCVHLYTYHAQMSVDGEVFPIQPDYVSVVPPGVQLEYSYRGHSTHCYAHFAVDVPSASQQDVVEIPAMQMRTDFVNLYEDMQGAVERFSTQPTFATARLWDILWRLSIPEDQTHSDLDYHPAVLAAQRYIESHLAEPISIRELAAQVHLSHNHLTRLFQTQLDYSVVAYIRKRRVERACHLLEQTTLPIRSVAAQVGISDLHAFNKVIRREMGTSPRNLRKGFGDK